MVIGDRAVQIGYGGTNEFIHKAGGGGSWRADDLRAEIDRNAGEDGDADWRSFLDSVIAAWFAT